ncbi:MAG: hypothetical protein NC092_10590 [Butyrivibrio sp.]|nr:hypothetical protein [Muribaculum sp.]MCM1553127.1 hypothetical protein [Butyrivibrio sp.]
MEKGKFGIRMCFYTVTAFLLAYLGYSTVLFLLAGVVILVEQNEWAGRQVIQAICLCVVENLVSQLLDIFDPIYRIPLISSVWGVATDLIGSVLSILVLLFCVVGILKNLKGEEANIIGASKLADWAYGIAGNKSAQSNE